MSIYDSNKGSGPGADDNPVADVQSEILTTDAPPETPVAAEQPEALSASDLDELMIEESAKVPAAGVGALPEFGEEGSSGFGVSDSSADDYDEDYDDDELGSTLDSSEFDDVKSSLSMIERLFILMRTLSTHGENHPTSTSVAKLFRQHLEDIHLPLAIQFVGQGVFRNRTLIPLEADDYRRARVLAKALHNLSVHELTFKAPPSTEDLLLLGRVLARGAMSPCKEMDDIKIEGMAWREIPGAQWGRDAVKIDPDVFAEQQITMAIVDVEEILSHPKEPWYWSSGIAVIRRIERAIDVDIMSAARALEIRPGKWTIARRAVTAAFHVLAVLRLLQLSIAARRAAGHASLALCCHGLKQRFGMPPNEVAHAVLRRMIDAPVNSKRGVEPHRLRACSIVFEYTRENEESKARQGLKGLVHLAYDLERYRCPENNNINLTFADLLAFAAKDDGETYEETWVRALITALGPIPAGTYVLLADGRVGIVQDVTQDGDPLRPKVLINDKTVIPDRPVVLMTPALVGDLGNDQLA